MNKIKSCAGCMALVKHVNCGVLYPYSCEMYHEHVKTSYLVYDKRLGSMINIKPINNNCKIRTNKEMVYRQINKNKN